MIEFTQFRDAKLKRNHGEARLSERYKTIKNYIKKKISKYIVYTIGWLNNTKNKTKHFQRKGVKEPEDITITVTGKLAYARKASISNGLQSRRLKQHRIQVF